MRLFKYFSLIFFCSLFLLGCSESLPFVSDPNNIFNGNTIPRAYIDNNYISVYYFDIVIINTHDETFDEKSKIIGTLEIDWKDAPITVNRKKTIQFTEKELIRAKGLNTQNGTLTMNPGDSLVFRVSWDLTTNDGSELLKNFPENAFNEILCQIRTEPYDDRRGALVSKSQSIETKAVIQLFSGKASVQVANNFNLCFIKKFYSNYDNREPCLKGVIENPCDLK